MNPVGLPLRRTRVAPLRAGARILLGLLVVLSVIAVCAPSAGAATRVLTLSTHGDSPDVAVDASGTAHVVWSQPAPQSNLESILEYCEIPRGATACTNQQSFVPPALDPTLNQDNYGPEVVLGPAGEVVLLTSRCCYTEPAPDGTPGGSNSLWAYVSTDDGQTFSAPRQIGTGLASADQHTQAGAIFGPGAFSVSVFEGDTGFQADPLTSYTSSSADVADVGSVAIAGSIGAIDAQTPIVAWETLPDSGPAVWTRRWSGSGDINDLSTWDPPVDLGRGEDPTLASGIHGVYLMDRTLKYHDDVYRVADYRDGAFGPPTTVTAPGDPVFGTLDEDSSGGLDAVWLDDHRDLDYRSSADGRDWSPTTTLVPEPRAPDPGIFDMRVSACAPGDGFVVWDANDLDGTVRAARLGDNHTCQPPASSSCPETLDFGDVHAQATDGCFARHGDSYTADGTVIVNGLHLVPGSASTTSVRAGGRRASTAAASGITIDPSAGSLQTSGQVQVQAGSLTLGHGPLNWYLPKQGGAIEVDDGSGNPAALDVGAEHERLLGLAINGLVLPRLTNGGTDLPLNLQVPSPVGGLIGGPLTQDVTLHADNTSVGGLDLTPGHFHLHLDDASLGIAELKPFDLEYTSDPEVLTGDVGLRLPVIGSDITTTFDFQQGRFVDATADLDFGTPGLPLASTVYLDGIDFHAHQLTDCSHPTVIEGSLTFSGGPDVAGAALLGVKGSFGYAFPESSCDLPGHFYADGAGSVGGIPAASLSFDYYTDGRVDFGADVGLDLKLLAFSGSLTGAIDLPTRQFYAEGKTSVTLVGLGQLSDADVLVSNAGIGACAQVSPLGGIPVLGQLLDGGFEYRWGGALEIHYPGCDVSDLRPVGLGPSARAADARPAFALPAGLPFAVVGVTSPSGVPAFSLSGPGGQRIQTPAQTEVVHTARDAIVPEPALHRVEVEIFHPRSGRWRLTADPGTTISGVTVADGLPTPSVQARVVGAGQRRTLLFHLRPIAGQRVQFIEQARDVSHLIGTATRSHGAISFLPADGHRERRTLTAIVLEHGLPRERIALGHYQSPGPLLPGKPRALRARRAHGGLTITFVPSTGAAHQTVRITLKDGRSPEFLLSPHTDRVTLGHVPGIDSAIVRVAGVTADGRTGPVASLQVRSHPARACSEHAHLPQSCTTRRHHKRHR